MDKINGLGLNIYLILGQSGRMLAQSAFEAGIPTVVIDQFGDQDTQQFSKAVKVISDFSDEAILQAVEGSWREYNFDGLILISGFEDRIDLIKKLSDKYPLLGNDHEVVRLAKDPSYLSDLLDKLKIKYPKIQFEPPEKGQWLVKQQGACGGDHIRWFDKNKTYSSNYYYQAFQEGKSCSVVFVADGKKAKIVGYNQTWTESGSSFRFGGAVTFNDFPLQQELEIIVNKISESLNLIGLCGLDFILDDDDQIHVLEINPRPVSTFDLHDEKSANLFSAHIDACRGELKNFLQAKKSYSAKAIVYAKSDLTIPDISWPEWVADIPQKGSVIKQDDPLCSIYATASDADKAVKLVHNHCDTLKIMKST